MDSRGDSLEKRIELTQLGLPQLVHQMSHPLDSKLGSSYDGWKIDSSMQVCRHFAGHLKVPVVRKGVTVRIKRQESSFHRCVFLGSRNLKNGCALVHFIKHGNGNHGGVSNRQGVVDLMPQKCTSEPRNLVERFNFMMKERKPGKHDGEIINASVFAFLHVGDNVLVEKRVGCFSS